jgi:transposase
MIRQRGSTIMATIKPHLSIKELEARYEAAADPTAKSHFHALWLVASGYTVSEVAKLLSFSTRWVNILVKRYNEGGPERLGDQRANNGAEPTILTAAALAALQERITSPPDDGGLWTGPKIALWLARFHDVTSVHDQRGWDVLVAIGYSIQQPRPRHPEAATEEERADFKKNSRKPLPRSVDNIRARKLRSGPRTSTGSA